MAETNTEKTPKTDKAPKTDNAPKTSWFTGLKAEFNKIIWPDKKSLSRQSAAVVAVSIVLGLIIAVLDVFIKYGVDALVNL
ncbi:MAG: preprotein translocase subunit SecE [Lachnospiraceae bacterium]|nr:preprotein translocase subunit SecE [Lachnospiraceae bacterium]